MDKKTNSKDIAEKQLNNMAGQELYYSQNMHLMSDIERDDYNSNMKLAEDQREALMKQIQDTL